MHKEFLIYLFIKAAYNASFQKNSQIIINNDNQ